MDSSIRRPPPYKNWISLVVVWGIALVTCEIRDCDNYRNVSCRGLQSIAVAWGVNGQ